MAIEFNAGTGANTGTITGLAVGGLPSGIIDADTVADSSIAAAKTAFGGGTKLKHIHCITNNTRASIATGQANTGSTWHTMWDLTYDKQFANTELVCYFMINGFGSTVSGAHSPAVYFESDSNTSLNQRITNCINFAYTGHSYMICSAGTAHCTTILPAGNVSIILQHSNPGSGTARPIQYINPSGSDDNRLTGGTESSVVIMEVEP